MFCTLPKINFNFSVTSNLSSESAVNLGKFENLALGREFCIMTNSPHT